MTKQKSKSMIQRRLIPTYIFLGIVSFISVFPLYWMISAATNTSTDGVKITILNTKSEIQTQWEELAQEYKELTGVDVEVSVTVGDSPSQDITKRYASGEVPTIFMGDIQDIICLLYTSDAADEL